MRTRGKVTALSQYFIDYFRVERLERGISAKKLSVAISPFEGETLVGQIEYEYSAAKYTPTTLKKALNYFDLNMEDILPDELLDDDQLIEKSRTHILKKMSVKAALNSLLEEGYFDTPRMRSEITAYYNSFLKKQDHKKDSDFSAQLEDLCNEGKLLKVQICDEDEKKTKLIHFVRNMELKEH